MLFVGTRQLIALHTLLSFFCFVFFTAVQRSDRQTETGTEASEIKITKQIQKPLTHSLHLWSLMWNTLLLPCGLISLGEKKEKEMTDLLQL